ncbi:MAG: hypothetical protein RI988_824 [Pseudomonadota bacterium]|jgi:hypothetical protein
MQTTSAWPRLARQWMSWSVHGLALLGMGLLVASALMAGHDGLREQATGRVMGWLQQRHELPAAAESDEGTVARAAGPDVAALTPQQSAVAQWLTRQYKVAPQPLALLVQESWALGQRFGIDPTLILAVVAVQSSFNPFAQGAIGAQGLMHVVTQDHDGKFEAFGGAMAAFDPLANLRVGVVVLQDSLRRAGGSLPEGLRLYLGAGDPQRQTGSAERVLAEQSRLRNVANAAPGQGRLASVTR